MQALFVAVQHYFLSQLPKLQAFIPGDNWQNLQ
jgi:hypothetical protein